MAVKTYSSREFNQDTSGAKRAANGGPVFITDRGRPAHVLLTYEHFRASTFGANPLILLQYLWRGRQELNPRPLGS